MGIVVLPNKYLVVCMAGFLHQETAASGLVHTQSHEARAPSSTTAYLSLQFKGSIHFSCVLFLLHMFIRLLLAMLKIGKLARESANGHKILHACAFRLLSLISMGARYRPSPIHCTSIICRPGRTDLDLDAHALMAASGSCMLGPRKMSRCYLLRVQSLS